MNQDFLRLLAGRLERVPWVDTRDSETYTEEVFTGVDGFSMSADVMTAPERCDVLCYEGRIVGSIAASIKPECQTPLTVAGPLCIRSGCFGLPYSESRGEVG